MNAAPGRSAYATRDEAAHAARLGRVVPSEVHEFYQPFTMVEGLVEFVRVISPGYGEMDFVYALDSRPAQIYTNSDLGERYLRERYPEAQRHRVREDQLLLADYERGQLLVGQLEASSGPFRRVQMVVRARPGAAYVTERYEAHGVWGSALDCDGIDTRVAARATGIVLRRNGEREAIDQEAVLFRGSYGRLAPSTPRVKAVQSGARRRTR